MSKVLIVDDDVLSTQMYATKLQSGGHEVILSSDGEEALEKIKDTFDLILLDIMMPKIDGVALLKEIKKGVNKQTVILIMTNLISEEVKKECLEALDYIRVAAIEESCYFACCEAFFTILDNGLYGDGFGC